MVSFSTLDFTQCGVRDGARRILIIYTGGTIGMKENPQTGALAPFDFDAIEQEVPELSKYQYTIDVVTMGTPIDSSDIDPTFWGALARLIIEQYDRYHGFVVLHGTDTMAYTASALSLMLVNLAKPVVITGSQLPIGAIRTDGKENLLGAVEIAATVETITGRPMVPEVSIFFNHTLLRGNRAKKMGSQRFDAFRSYNYPPLATAGITIRYDPRAIRPLPSGPLELLDGFCLDVATLRIFPGVTERYLTAMLDTPWLKGLILETYGAGNAPSAPWLLQAVERAVQRGVLVVNNTQCPADGVSMESYDAGLGLSRAGVISAGDMTLEASIVKLMLALGQEDTTLDQARRFFLRPMAGELG